MQTNYLDTVKDNLRGQCKMGHSCKMSTQEKLRSTIDIEEEGHGGLAVRQDGENDNDDDGDDDDSGDDDHDDYY